MTADSRDSDKLNEGLTSPATAKMMAQIAAQQNSITKSLAVFQQSSSLQSITGAVEQLGQRQSALAKGVMAYQRIAAGPDFTRMMARVQEQNAELTRSISVLAGAGSLSAAVAKIVEASSTSWSTNLGKDLTALAAAAARSSLPVTSMEILRPLTAFSEFSARTATRLAELDSRSPLGVAIAASMMSAQRQLDSASVLAPKVLDLAVDESTEDEPKRLGRLNLLVVVQEEYVAAAGSGGVRRIDDFELVSLAEKAADRCRRFQELLSQCNQLAEQVLGGKIFTYTDRTVATLFNLPWMTPRTQLQMEGFVTGLYFMIYEGAGSKNLRFMQPGLLVDSDCGFVWHLKHLRNKWLEHDIEHGSKSDIRRSREDLKEALAYFGLLHAPLSREDFRRLHRAILDEAVPFLELLLQRLKDMAKA